jgi:hypothetical protein
MGNIRGLRTRLCPKCNEITPHRTLYVKTRKEWLQIFWACAKCNSPNHIILPAYRLGSAASPPPSSLAEGIVNILCAGPLDLDELIMTLRKNRPVGVNHVFNSEVVMALEFLKRHGVVKEESSDRTARVLELLRANPRGTGRLGTCPREGHHARSLVSIYAQKSKGTTDATRLESAGVLCRNCLFVRLNSG